MTKTSIWLTMAIFFVISLVFGSIANPPQVRGPGAGGFLIGSALAIFAAGGVIPIVCWAFMTFKAEKAKGVMVGWFFAMLAFAAFTYIGTHPGVLQ